MPRPRSDSWRVQSSARRPLPRPRALPRSGFSSLERPAACEKQVLMIMWQGVQQGKGWS